MFAGLLWAAVSSSVVPATRVVLTFRSGPSGQGLAVGRCCGFGRDDVSGHDSCLLD